MIVSMARMRQPHFDYAPRPMQSEGRCAVPEVFARMNPLSPLASYTSRLGARLRLNEAGPLLSLCLVSMFAWGFVQLAGEVSEGDTTKLDRAILLALRNPNDLSDPIGPIWFEEAARDITGLGGHAILGLVSLAAVVYLLLARKRGAALLVVASVGGGMLLSSLLKLGFERPRPDLVPHGMRVYTASFPSGHAMLSAVTYLTLGALLARVEEDRRIKAFLLGLAIALTLLIGMSRIYLGVHWPSDVLGGWCGGAAWASLCWFVALQLQRRGELESGDRSSLAR
jgi:undecaprenyl-diphosphatase